MHIDTSIMNNAKEQRSKNLQTAACLWAECTGNFPIGGHDNNYIVRLKKTVPEKSLHSHCSHVTDMLIIISSTSHISGSFKMHACVLYNIDQI